MKIMTKSSEGIIIAETWQDILHKHTRIDIVEYVLVDSIGRLCSSQMNDRTAVPEDR